MTTSPPSKQTQQLLASARQKLLAPHVPALLRITAFLRLSCAALGTDGAYPQLMQALFRYDKEWWKACEVSPDGVLCSSDPEIYWLLEPVLQLYTQTLTISVPSADQSLSSVELPVQG